MTNCKPFTLPVSTGATLDGLIDLPAASGRRPAIVICHGFKGFMEWGFFPYLADLLAQRGFVVVRFNFSGSGMRPGEDLVTDLEAFRKDTPTKTLEELTGVLEATAGELAGDRVDPQRIGLFGHSRGGGIALLGACQPAWRDRVRALITWSAVSRFDRFSPEEKEQWRRTGFVTVVNARTGQELQVSVEALEDLERNRPQLDLEAAAARRQAPWLIAHGEDDETVPVEEGRQLELSAAGTKQLLVVPGGDHTFGSRHPFPGPTPRLIEVLNATQEWFGRYLR
jgi:pimeloyl-ACP methyl ester carboxylesterase